MAPRLGRIAIDRAFFESRVARRLFGVFVACALIPMATFALFAQRAVREQLEDDAAMALRSESKASGMAITERLLLADAALRMRIRAGEGAAHAGPDGPHEAPLRHVERVPDGDPRLRALDARALDHLRGGSSLVEVGAGAVLPPILLLRRAASDTAHTWIAEIDRKSAV